MSATYIFPDIHGCAKTLQHLLEEVVVPTREDRLIFLGDYIDRGPESARVIEMLLALIYSGYNVVALRGNHEQMLLDSLTDESKLTLWLLNSARKTLMSYSRDVEAVTPELLLDAIPKKHIRFFQEMPILHSLGNSRWCVHGGVQFPIEEKYMQQYLWLRPWESVDSIPEGATIIHGHTPIPFAEVERQVHLFGRQVNLDAGCVYAGFREGLGYLTCLRLEDQHLFFVQNMDW